MIAWIVAGVIAAIVVVAILVLSLRRRAPDRIADDADAAMEVAGASLSAFEPWSAAIGADRRVALVLSSAGRVAVVLPKGKRSVAREIPWRAIRATRDGLEIDTGTRRFGRVIVAGVTSLDVRRLAPLGVPLR